jgi:hypothetical protein
LDSDNYLNAIQYIEKSGHRQPWSLSPCILISKAKKEWAGAARNSAFQQSGAGSQQEEETAEEAHG